MHHIPQAFKVTDPKAIQRFAQHFPFGVLVSANAELEIYETHLPVTFNQDGSKLLGHIARANPQWRTWKPDQPVKVLFRGPHAYISPSDYASDFNVPTWNYAAATATGVARILESRTEQIELIQTMVSFFEADFPTPWRFDPQDSKLAGLLSGIVCFEINALSWEAQFKLNQNKSDPDRKRVIKQLAARGSSEALALAEFMQESI